MPICMVIGGGPILTFRSKAVGTAAMLNMDGGPPSGSRYLVATFAYSDGGSVGTPTINGIPMTMIGAPVSSGTLPVSVHMGIALVPTSQFVSVAPSAGVGAGPVCSLYSLLGIASPVPTLALNVNASTFAAPSASAIVGVACGVNNPSPNPNWSGLTQDASDHFGFSSTRTGTSAHRQVDTAIASLAINPNWSTSVASGNAGKLTMWQ